MDSNDFRQGWITQFSHGSATGEIAKRLLVPFPAVFDGFTQIVTKNWPHLKLGELQCQELSLSPAAPLDLLFRHGHDVAITNLAQLLRNHTTLRSCAPTKTVGHSDGRAGVFRISSFLHRPLLSATAE